MRSDRLIRFTLSAAIAGASGTSPAHAKSCNHEIIARVQMAAGEACWTYRGTATTFVGEFSHGQRIAAQMVGQASEADPRSGRIVTSWRPRDPNVEGPGGFFFGDAQAPGDLAFVAPDERNLPFQLLALRDVGRAGGGEDLRPMTEAVKAPRLARRLFRMVSPNPVGEPRPAR